MLTLNVLVIFLNLALIRSESRIMKEDKRQSESSKKCNFGDIPGYWNLHNKVGDRYNTIDPECELKNFMDFKYFDDSNKKKNPIRMLFLSDSVDVHVIKSVCITLRNESQWWNLNFKNHFNETYRFDTFNFYELGRFQIGMRYIPGVHIDGPYHMDLTGGFYERSRLAKREFFKQFKAHPDVIIISSNYWDASRLHFRQNISGSDTNGLTKSEIEGYIKNLTTWVQYLRDLYEPRFHNIIYHTHPQPALKAYNQIFNHFIWDELNSAGKATAMKLGLNIVDYDRIARPFSPKVLMKSDGLHPNEWFDNNLSKEKILLVAEDCKNNCLSIETIEIIYNSVKCNPGKFSELMYGNKITLSGLVDFQPLPSKELIQRRKFLQRRAEEKEYNKMAHGTEENPEKERILEQEQRISSFKNQLSITSNMIVSTGVSCGMGYYIGSQLKFDASTSLVFGLVAGILVMIIEMILFITRSVRMEQVLGKEVHKTSKENRIH